MILYNTTFHIESSIDESFFDWIKARFIPAAMSSGFVNPMLMRLIDRVEPGCTSYALHLYADNMDYIARWEHGVKNELVEEMMCKWGERALAFSTPMEVVEL